MRPSDRRIVDELIERIEGDSFTEIEVRSLFMTLRAYSKNHPVFTEIAHFVAHNDERNSGVSNRALQTMKLRMRFFIEYNSPKKPLDLSEPFPLWIKNLMILQVDKAHEEKLKEEFKVDRATLKQRIHRGIISDRKSQTAKLKKNKTSKNTLNAVSYIMSFLSGNSSFTQDDLINDVFSALSDLDIKFGREAILAISDKFTLCTMLLMHRVGYIDEHKNSVGETQIGAETASILHGAKFVDNEGKAIENPQSFGNLGVQGVVEVDNKGKIVKVVHSIMSSSLCVTDWCDQSLFKIEQLDYPPPNIYKTLSLEEDLSLSNEFKLIAI